MALNDPSVPGQGSALGRLHLPARGDRDAAGTFAQGGRAQGGRAQSTAAQHVGSHDWRRRFTRMLAITDFSVLTVVVLTTQLIWFGTDNAQVAIRSDSRLSVVSYWMFSAALVLIWMWAITLVDSRAHQVIGDGTTEYVLVFRASLLLFGVIAILAFLFRVDVARGYLLISLPAGVVALVMSRWSWRQWLIARRKRGEYSARVILVGSRSSVSRVGSELRRESSAGYVVVGACLVHPNVDATIDGIPVLGSVDDIRDAMTATGADTVAITSTGELAPTKLKELSWKLTPGHQHLVLAPSLVDVAGPRIHIRPIAGLPLIHVDTPRFSRGQALVKRLFDIGASIVLMVVFSPVLLAVAAAVRLSDGGPVLFGHERIGQNGAPFRIWKFRSMRVGADKQLDELLAAQGASETPLFKVKDDPRITRVGRVLRKYSLDELPQLFNVLSGSMSLVGPRPQVAAEVALYSDAAMRRLMVRPGITGLWQVSGRSTLSWAEAVRLDLFYVENWSLGSDLVILARTLTAVVSPGESAH